MDEIGELGLDEQAMILRAVGNKRFLAFATSLRASWNGNFRDLSASVTRMATLSPDGRIDRTIVDAETPRLERLWASGDDCGHQALLASVLTEGALANIDPFDRTQLAKVITTCRRHPSLSAAGGELFASSSL